MVFKTEKYMQWYRLKGCILFILTAFILLFACTMKDSRVVVQAATKTITVKKADAATAKKVHKYLYKGKALTLKVKGNSQKSKKLVKSLVKKVGVVNKYDVVFHYTPSYQSGRYYYYSVSRENAQLYKYSVKAVKKMVKYAKNSVDYMDGYKNAKKDAKKYPNERERKMRIIYDNLIRRHIISRTPDGDSYETYNADEYTFIGYDKPTTVSLIDRWSIPSEVFDRDELVVKERDGNTVYLYSFDEFVALVDVDVFVKETDFYELEGRDLKVMSTPFYKLSDAMKVYVISCSGSFMCGMPLYGDEYIKIPCCVQYHYTKRTPTTGSKGMKSLYTGNAFGVCVQYAQYECLLWDQLGITNYYNSSNKISHAWSVVKVKNSKGKTLWIPFDYGMGPCSALNVGQDQYKYIDTEKKRYKLYLSGIKGAPKKRNWKWSDIN